MDNKEKSPEQELIESIGLMIEKGVESNTNIYTGVVKSVDGKRAVVSVNGQNQNVSIVTANVSSGNVVRVFVPEGNMSAAFIIKAEASGGGGGTTTTAYGDLTGKPRINGVTLVDNKTSKELKLYGTDNAPPYPVTSVNGQTGDVTISAGGNVDSVNGKTGVVVLNKSDVGLGNVDNVRQYSASNPPPYPVQSVDGATGAVVTNAVKTTPQSLSDTQKQQVRNNIGAGTSSFDGDYNSLNNKPTIPTKTSQLDNDSGFITDIPIASTTQLGGIKVGAGLSVTENGVLSATGGGTADAVEWNNVLDKPTTIAGYGITDAKIENGTITLGNKTITPLTSAPVTSVNSKTGAVVLRASDVGAISTGNISQTLGTSTTKVPSEKAVSDALSSAGFGDMLKSTYDPTGSVATAGGIPEYVEANGGKIDTIKVNGTAQVISDKTVNITVPTKTSDITNDSGYLTSAPVTSVNSKTGDVVLTAGDVGALPADTVIPTVNNAILTIRRNSVDIGSFTANSANDVNIDINVPTDKSDIGLGNVDNVKQYSASNPPPYPVTSVNGHTGAITIREVPAVTTTDNGKFLRVVNGAWAAVAIADANGVKF